VTCDPPDTITPSHHTLDPGFISTFKVLPTDDEPDEYPVVGLEDPVVLGSEVGAEVGTGVGATDPVAEEPEEEEAPEDEEEEEEEELEPDSYRGGPGMM